MILCNIPVVMPADKICKCFSQCHSCSVFTQTKWVSALSDGGSMWINQNCCARRDAVTMEMLHGRVCAPSAGERSTRKLGRGRSRRTGPWLKSELGGFAEELSNHTFWVWWLNLDVQIQWCVFCHRLQREEEAAYVSIHSSSQTQPPHSHSQHSLATFSKFEEKKTNEKTRKVTTVKKFFSPSSRTAPKKGMKWAEMSWEVWMWMMMFLWEGTAVTTSGCGWWKECVVICY